MQALYELYRSRKEKVLRSWSEVRRILEKEVLPAWRHRRVMDIRRRDSASTPRRATTGTALTRRTLAPAGSYSQIGKCRKSRENASFQAWAQGVAGSNPVAPTTFLKNLHNTHEERELAESSAVLAICLASPRIAPFFAPTGTQFGLDENRS